jgi:hypothetical protein
MVMVSTPDPIMPSSASPVADAPVVSSDPERHRAEALAAAMVLSILAVLALWHQAPGQSPGPIPAAQAEPWMADCLPRIGARTRVKMAEALRADAVERLPLPAQVQAARWFTW